MTAELITVTYTHIWYDDDLRFSETGDGTIGVTVKGHALFGAGGPGKDFDAAHASKKGSNIVCAAVSFAALTLLRSITIIAEIEPECTIEDGLLDFTIDVRSLNEDKRQIIRVLLESFMIGMLDLKKKYRDTITIHTVA